MTNTKRTRSQLTLDNLPANFEESPYKVARARTQLARAGSSLKSSLQTSTAAQSDSEDELMLSPSKKAPRFMSPAKRPPSPLQGNSAEKSEEREPKRRKQNFEPITNLPSPTASPKRAESAAPDSPSRRAEIAAAAPNLVSRAQSVPAFPQNPFAGGVLGFKDGVPRLDLANPALSPSRRSKSPERNVLKIIPVSFAPSKLEPIVDEKDVQHDEPPIIPQSTTPKPATPQTPTRLKILDNDQYFNRSPLTPAIDLPSTESGSTKSIRKAKELEAMQKDQEQFDSARKAKLEKDGSTPSHPIRAPKLATKLSAKSPVKKGPPPVVSKTNVSAPKTPVASSSRVTASASLAALDKKVVAQVPFKKKPPVPSAVAALNRPGLKKLVSGKNSPNNPKQDKRSTLGKAALPVQASVKNLMKKKGGERPKPVPVVREGSGPMDAFVVVSQREPSVPEPSEAPEEVPAAAPAEEPKEQPDFFRLSSLTPPPTSEPSQNEQPFESATPPTLSPTTTPLPNTQTTPKAGSSKPDSKPQQPKARPILNKPSNQRRLTRSNSVQQNSAEAVLTTPVGKPRASAIPKPVSMRVSTTSSTSKEAPVSLGSRSPSKGMPSPPKVARSISNPNIQFSSRFEGKNGEPSALDTLTRALAKLNVPPPSRPNSSLGVVNSDNSLQRTESFSEKRKSEAGPSRPSTAAGPSSAAGSSKSAGKIDSYFKPKPFLPAGSGTGRGLPRDSLAPGLMKNRNLSRPRSFGPGVTRGLRASKQPTLPSVMASPVKGGEYVDTEMPLADASMDDESELKTTAPEGEASTASTPTRKSGVGLMGPPEVPPSKKEVDEDSSRPSGSKKRNEGLPTVSSDAADALSSCVVFVDVRTESGDNAGELFCEMLQDMGARVLKTVGQTCTHIVYKDGLVSTLNKYRALHEPRPKVVSLTWVADCVEQGIHVPEDEYLIDLMNVNLAGLSKRRRSILPKLLSQEMDEKKSKSPASDDDRSVESSHEDDRPPSRTRRRRA